METTTKRVRRTNEQILADYKIEREEIKNRPRKRRRTKAEMERDRRKEEDAKIKAELLNVDTCNVVTFYDEINAFGRLWFSGDEVKLTPGSYHHALAYDKFDNFILDKTADEQLKLWGKIKYVVRKEPV